MPPIFFNVIKNLYYVAGISKWRSVMYIMFMVAMKIKMCMKMKA